MIDLLFGRHRSWQRRVCIALSGVLVVFGVLFMVFEDVVEGVGVILVGLVSGAVLSRVAEESASQAATDELLTGIRRIPEPPGRAPGGPRLPAELGEAKLHLQPDDDPPPPPPTSP